MWPRHFELSAVLFWLLVVLNQIGAGAATLTCTSGTTYASTFSAGGIVTTSITDSTELNAALASLSSANPTGAILDLAPGTYSLDQLTDQYGDVYMYQPLGNVCIQSTDPGATSVVAASTSRHLVKSNGILQLVGLTLNGGSSGFTHGGVVVSNAATRAAFENVKFYGNDFSGSQGGALEINGGIIHVGDGVIFDTNTGDSGGQMYIAATGNVTIGE